MVVVGLCDGNMPESKPAIFPRLIANHPIPRADLESRIAQIFRRYFHNSCPPAILGAQRTKGDGAHLR